MTKLIATAAIAVAGAAVLLAQTGPTTRPQPPAALKPAATAAVTAQPADAKTDHAFVNKYCINRPNSRSAHPASDPLDLEKASLDDVIASAATWERVLNKLNV